MDSSTAQSVSLWPAFSLEKLRWHSISTRDYRESVSHVLIRCQDGASHRYITGVSMITRLETETSHGPSPAAVADEITYERWNHWPVNWTAVWIGALSAVAAVLVFGLIGIAIGAHVLDPTKRVVDLHKVGLFTLIYSVFSAFLAFVIAGWVAGKIAGILRSEPAMLHGAIAWLVAVPGLLLLGAIGMSSFFGGWYGGLAGSPAWAAPATAPFERPEALAPSATATEQEQHAAAMSAYRQQIQQWKEETPKATRNSALGAVTALLLGLVGSVIGGWLASGEPMNFTHYRTRRPLASRGTT